jgi:hypothetical protein
LVIILAKDEVAPSPRAWEKVKERLETKPARKRFWPASPLYHPPQAPGLPDPRWMLGAYTNYTIDGVVHDAGVAAMNPLDDGLRLQWGYGQESLDPIPIGAKELAFTITKLGDWEGPWTFMVPLQ